jgi:hypothetical protein
MVHHHVKNLISTTVQCKPMQEGITIFFAKVLDS